MDNIFSTLGDVEQQVEVKSSKAGNDKKEQLEELKEAFKQTIATNPEFLNSLNKLSNSVEVVNTLGFGEGGNFILNKEESAKGKREFIVVSYIVGYRIKNIGSVPIEYKTSEWSKDASGRYVEAKVVKTLYPGETADLSRKYMSMLASRPEFSFQFANGKLTIKGINSLKSKNVNDILEGFYFRFNKELNLQVNDDAIKLNVGEKINDTWVVKPEFETVFGYLNNPKEEKERTRKASPKFTAQDLVAHYVNKLISESNL